MKTGFTRRLRIEVALTVALYALYPVLLHWMADHRIIEVLLTGGSTASVSHFLIAVTFVVVRFLVVLVLPAFWITRLIFILGPHLRKRTVSGARSENGSIAEGQSTR